MPGALFTASPSAQADEEAKHKYPEKAVNQEAGNADNRGEPQGLFYDEQHNKRPGGKENRDTQGKKQISYAENSFAYEFIFFIVIVHNVTLYRILCCVFFRLKIIYHPLHQFKGVLLLNLFNKYYIIVLIWGKMTFKHKKSETEKRNGCYQKC